MLTGTDNMVRSELTSESRTTMTSEELPWLDVRDVAQVLGEERERARQMRAGVPEHLIDVSQAKPLAGITVQTYAFRQRRPGARRQYQDMATEARPFPAPTYPSGGHIPMPGEHPTWPILTGETRDQVKDRFRVWYRLRKGPGQGGGRPRKVTQPPPAPVPDDQQPAAAHPRRRKGRRADG